MVSFFSLKIILLKCSHIYSWYFEEFFLLFFFFFLATLGLILYDVSTYFCSVLLTNDQSVYCNKKMVDFNVLIVKVVTLAKHSSQEKKDATNNLVADFIHHRYIGTIVEWCSVKIR